MSLVIGAILVFAGLLALWEFFEGMRLAGERDWSALIPGVLFVGFGIFLIVRYNT